MVASLDMRCMARVLEVNPEARTARAEAGILGPALERALNARSLTLGHFPDSFLYSTLGGWVATRSAGMQSDKYGNIEDMVVSLGLVTPRGTLRPRDVPRSSAGPDLRQLGLGSEGTLGVITDVTIRVHEMPDARCFEAWLFPDFASGVEAMRECRVRGRAPMMMRLNDPGKTALSMAFKTNTSRIEAFVSKAFGMYLARLRRFPMPRACLLVAGFEGTAREVRAHRRDAARIYARHGAVGLGAGPGRAMERAKYDFPCARDFLMDRNIMGDVSETSTAWSNILPLYDAVTAAIRRAATEVGTSLFLGCHISHSYHAGASLYFTFAGEHRPGEGDEFAQYLRIKRAAQDAFLRYGGTLSHHHAVGTEHLPWLAEELGPAGLEALAAQRRGLDPRGVMNPGKLGRDGAAIEVWDNAPPAAVTHLPAAAAAPIA